MKAKFPLITLFAVGAIAGFLIFCPWWPLSSNSAGKSSSPREVKNWIASPVARDRDPKGSSPAALKGKTKDSARDLNGRILDALKAGEPLDHELVFGDLLRDLVGEDPESAARLAGSLAAGPLREEMMRRLAQCWAEVDAAGAKQWAERLTDSGERDAALTDVCFQIARADPRQATLLADHYGLGEQQGAPLENLVMQWAAKDLESVTAWVGERPEGVQKDAMLARVAMVMAKTSPAEAAEMVATRLPEGEAQTESVISIVHQWAVRDLPGARAWAGLFPEGPLRDRALGELKGIEQYQRASGQGRQ